MIENVLILTILFMYSFYAKTAVVVEWALKSYPYLSIVANLCVHYFLVSDSGGGSGGHVAVHLSEHYRFDGTLQALGGDGFSHGNRSGFAAPGTVLRLSDVGGEKTAQLSIDHQNRGTSSCDHSIYLPSLLEFATLNLVRTACVRVATVSVRAYTGSMVFKQVSLCLPPLLTVAASSALSFLKEQAFLS